MDELDVIVIGGGAAGMMAALSAREEGASVLLLESNEKLGRKLYITGKGRCNLCNDSTEEVVLQHVVSNPRFLHSALAQFPPSAVKQYFSDLGVPLKTERGGRVFPQSDKSADIIDALFWKLQRQRVKSQRDKAEHLLVNKDRIVGVKTNSKVIYAKSVILATGGVSYPLTGSKGDGHRMAEEQGHKIVPLRASLVPLVEDGETCSQMQGLSLKNVKLTIKNKKKKVIFEEVGELLFTHFGMSGPLVLSASCHMKDFAQNGYTAIIDLKPALDEEKLEDRILRDFGENPNKNFQSILEGLLPRLMVPVMLDKLGIDGRSKVNLITKGQRRNLIENLKQFRVAIREARPIEEAIVTAGGVSTKEVDPKTFMSKKVDGLFFAGELLDLDAYTGGFNLQIAWSTGRAAGLSAGRYCKEEESHGQD